MGFVIVAQVCMIEARWPKKRALEIEDQRVCHGGSSFVQFKAVQTGQLYHLGGCDLELEMEVISQKCSYDSTEKLL